jgi:hypothetical protein
MPAEIEPPELAALVDYSERSRVDDWSLRSAITRYAQPQPVRASAVLELVRRIEFALKPHNKLIEKEGPALWAALQTDDDDDSDDGQVVGLMRAMVELDGLGDTLAAWAVDRAGERPDAAVDAVAADVDQRLKVLGGPREQQRRQRPG